MFTAIALFVSTALMATGVLYLFLFFTKRRRKGDFWFGALAAALAVSYSLYAFEDSSYLVRVIEAIVDGAIGLLLVFNLRRIIHFTLWERKDAGHH